MKYFQENKFLRGKFHVPVEYRDFEKHIYIFRQKIVFGIYIWTTKAYPKANLHELFSEFLLVF